MYIGKVLLPFFVKCLILEYLNPFDVTNTLRTDYLDHPSVLFLFFVAVQNQRRKASGKQKKEQEQEG